MLTVRAALAAVLLLNWPWPASFAAAQEGAPAFVRSLLDSDQSSSFDFAHAELMTDHYIDPSVDVVASLAEIDTMVATINQMLTTLPADAASTSIERMRALRAFLYKSGWWNNQTPFTYDFDDSYGQNPGNRLLSSYLASKKGNCFSMPILFLVLGERLGLEVTLSTAPLHVFVKWTDKESGTTYNLETTSGAGATRDAWYRQKLPMTDTAIANGVYMKTLTRRETLAVIATPVLEHLLLVGRYEDGIAVADELLKAYPAYAYALVKKGTAYYRLLDEQFMQKYPRESDIPADQLPRALALYQANQEAFAKAEAMGWRQPNLR